jgi:anti-sigma regulatory factor (Ser/Thr protein kinase)
VLQRPFAHQALLYRDEAEFVAEVARFIDEGVARGDAVLVVVPPAQIAELRSALGGPRNGEQISFLDVTEAGRNPATILPLWIDFVEQNLAAGRGFRGVGEPVWPGRSEAALVECRNHEGLLNLYFEDGPRWELLCPYDAGRLDDRTIEDARATHPRLLEHGEPRLNAAYDDASGGWLGFDDPLPPPASPPRELPFGRGSLHEVREFVAAFARQEGSPPDRRADLILAVNEIVANSIRYGGGHGLLSLWRDGDTFVCEVSDRGTISDPFAGRRRPTSDQFGGRGLWIANHSCDLVQIRSRPGTTSVRLHMGIAGHVA